MIRPVTIPPDQFVKHMTEHWQGTLNNTASKPLKDLWLSMAQTYEDAIWESSEHDPNETCFTSKWRVLQPPTGTGKSQGAALYAALCAIENQKLDAYSDDVTPTHCLLVVRQKVQCQELCEAARCAVQRIAPYLDAESLVDYHNGDHELTPEERKAVSVLIVTHAAYVGAVSQIEFMKDRFESFTTYHDGQTFRRNLTIIDESLGSVVETSQVTHDNLVRLDLCVPPGDYLREKFKEEIKAAHQVRALLEKTADELKDHRGSIFRDVQELPDPDALDFPGFLKELRKRDLALMIQKTTSKEDRDRYRKAMVDTINDLVKCLRQWRYYAREQLSASSLNTSRFLIPENLVAPVCLDATATTNVLWDLIGAEHAKIVEPVEGARSYRNVKLNVAFEKMGVGKGTMIKRKVGRCIRLVAELEAQIKPTESVLVVCHKAVKGTLINHLSADPEAPRDRRNKNAPAYYHLSNGAKVYVNNWYALDGLNTYQHCEHVVLFGLPYQNDTWSLSMIFAIRGYKPELFHDQSMNGHVNYPQYLEFQQIALMIIQAINRVRCRRVVDTLGNCKPTNVWMILPPEYTELSQFILDAIDSDMPSIQRYVWDYRIDEAERRLHTRYADKQAAPFALTEFLSQCPVGEVTLKQAAKDLGLSKGQTDRLKKTLRDDASDLSLALKEMHVSYEAGRGKVARFIKKYVETI